MSREIYPEMPLAPETAPPLKDPDRAEAHAVSQMLQIMENTWLSLGLRRYSDLPLNRGWVNTFRRWVNTPAFQRLWPSLRPEYGTDFCRFCEEQLHLTIVKPAPVQIGDPAQQLFEADAIKLLGEEYRREWPFDPAPGWDDLLTAARALPLAKPGPPPVWLIVQEPSPPAPPAGAAQPAGTKFVTGIILAASFPNLDAEFSGLVVPEDGRWHGSDVELFVWMRRGYRSTLLGLPSVREVIDTHLPAALGVAKEKLPTLWARYPKPGEHGESDHEWGVWLNFLARFNFRRCYAKRPTRGKAPCSSVNNRNFFSFSCALDGRDRTRRERLLSSTDREMRTEP